MPRRSQLGLALTAELPADSPGDVEGAELEHPGVGGFAVGSHGVGDQVPRALLAGLSVQASSARPPDPIWSSFGSDTAASR